jgi:outer membrane lipoprotein SlyB
VSQAIDTVLKSLLDRYGLGLLDQSNRLKSLLQDEVPGSKREISVLMLALDERVPQDLMRVQSGEPLQSLRPRLAKRLADEKALDRKASNWAVSTWAQGLGVATAQDFEGDHALDGEGAQDAPFESDEQGDGTDGGDGKGQGTTDDTAVIVPPPPASWLERNKVLVGAGVLVAALLAWVSIPSKLEITSVHAEGLVGDGRKHDVVVDFKHAKAPVQSIEVRYVRGAGPWNPATWTSNLTPEAAASGAASAGQISIRSTKPLTTTFEYTLVAADGTRSAPFEQTLDIAAAPVTPPSIVKLDVHAPVYTGHPVNVAIAYQSGTSDVARVEVRHINDASAAQAPVVQNLTGTSGKTSGTVNYALPVAAAPQHSTVEFVLIDTQGGRSEPQRVSFDSTIAPASAGFTGAVIGIHAVSAQGESTGVGAVVGGILGGILGHQVGGGRGKTVATVAGVAAGAVAGDLVEKNAGPHSNYQVSVRMDNGETKVYTAAGAPNLKVGDRVKVVNGVLMADR